MLGLKERIEALLFHKLMGGPTLSLDCDTPEALRRISQLKALALNFFLFLIELGVTRFSKVYELVI